MRIRPVAGRKLLIASIGVAAVSYAACGAPQRTGNLMPPQESSDAGASPETGAPPVDTGVTSGNLVAPPTQDTTTIDGGRR